MQLKRGIQTELPPDYIELEKRVDALKQVHQKLLQVTYTSDPSAIAPLSTPQLTTTKLAILKRSLRLPSQHPRVLQ